MKYLTSNILEMLAVEKEENSLVSKELLNETIAWIDKFKSFPEIEFDLVGDFEFLLPYLESNKAAIEKTVIACRNKIQRKYGPVPNPPELLRSHHIGVYLNDAEMAKLAIHAGTQIPKQKRGGDTASRRKIAAYLRDAGLNALPPVVPKINSEVWTELAPVLANLNQIAKKRNCGGELDEGDLLAIKTIKDALTELRPKLIKREL